MTIKDAAGSFDLTIEPAQIDLESEAAEIIDVVRVQAKIKKGSAQTEVQGEIAARVAIECTRCLQPVEQALDFGFKAAFVTPEFYTSGREAEINLDDLEVSVHEGDRVDLSELAREQILLNLPEQVFCRKDCLGLCLKCGVNRNLVNCKCEEKEIDPRWAALRNLN